MCCLAGHMRTDGMMHRSRARILFDSGTNICAFREDVIRRCYDSHVERRLGNSWRPRAL